MIEWKIKKFIVYKDGNIKGKYNSEDNAFIALHKLQPNSISHAIKYEGWEIKEKIIIEKINKRQLYSFDFGIWDNHIDEGVRRDEVISTSLSAAQKLYRKEMRPSYPSPRYFFDMELNNGPFEDFDDISDYKEQII